jgi:hypothetical protein
MSCGSTFGDDAFTVLLGVPKDGDILLPKAHYLELHALHEHHGPWKNERGTWQNQHDKKGLWRLQ